MVERVKLLDAAEEALEDIYKYTRETFGVEKALNYSDFLRMKCETLPEQKAFWRTLERPNGKSPVPFIKVQSHYVFFQERQSGFIAVIAILHERMDLISRLNNLLD